MWKLLGWVSILRVCEKKSGNKNSEDMQKIEERSEERDNKVKGRWCDGW